MKKSENEITPLFSYVGGKRWLKKELNFELESIILKNKNIDTYYEPFMGGLGAFFSNIEILKKYNIKNVILNDLNTSLYSFYKNLINNNLELFELYDLHELNFEKLVPKEIDKYHKIKDKNIIKEKLKLASLFYKEKRAEFNQIKKEDSVENAALFLFLQNHCFNGFYRENRKGNYNTAFNWEGRKSLNNATKIQNMVKELSYFNLVFLNEDYKNLKFEKNYILYVDPPYINNILGTENNYNKDSFSIQDMKILIEMICSYNYIFSHYKNDSIIDIFKGYNYNIKFVERKNTVSGHKETRGKIQTEIVISSSK